MTKAESAGQACIDRLRELDHYAPYTGNELEWADQMVEDAVIYARIAARAARRVLGW